MQVLQICHSYYPPFLDCARQYASLFSGTGYRVVTVYLTGEPDAEIERATCSDEVIFLGYKSRQVRGLKLNAIARIRQIVAEHNFLFCITHRAKPAYVALLATKLPVISVHHNFDDFGRFSRRLMVNIFRERLFMLGVSDAVRDDMRTDLPKWPKQRIQTLYNRIDADAVKAELLSRTDARQALNLPEHAWVVANVGRLHHDKDQATLIRGFAKALADLPGERLLVIMGKGPLERSLKQLAHDLGVTDNIRFTGQIADAKKYFRAFDVFALTSDHEPFGMVLLEAMAAEVPIICSDCGGGAEIVRDFAELFPLGDAEQLAGALIKIAGNKNDDAQARMHDVLHDRFTDAAVRKHFWELDFVKHINNKMQKCD